MKTLFRPDRILRTCIMLAPLACKGTSAKKAAPPTPVRVSPVARIDAPVVILASGVVEPMQTVAVTAQTSGALLDVLFHEGDYVARGQTLFHLDRRPLQAAVDQATANLARDQAQAAAAKHDDERYAALAALGYVSRSQADSFHATSVAQAATVAADRAALRSAQVNLGYATIRAPIAGRTGSLLVRTGNNVTPSGGPLVVINQISPVLVRFPVLEQDFAPLQSAVATHPLVVQAAASDSGQARETGRLSFLDNAVDSLTGTVTGKANFPNEAHHLWPGELVFLTVQLDVQHGVLGVPNDAVLIGQQGPYVYVLSNQGTAITETIATGSQVGDMTVVLRGLTAGERVIVDGQSRLNPGARVALVTGNPSGDTSRTGMSSATAGGDVTTGRAGTPGAVTGSATAQTNGSGVPGGTGAIAPSAAPSAAPMSGNPSSANGTNGSTTNPATTNPSPTNSPTTNPPANNPSTANPPVRGGATPTAPTPAARPPVPSAPPTPIRP